MDTDVAGATLQEGFEHEDDLLSLSVMEPRSAGLLAEAARRRRRQASRSSTSVFMSSFRHCFEDMFLGLTMSDGPARASWDRITVPPVGVVRLRALPSANERVVAEGC